MNELQIQKMNLAHSNNSIHSGKTKSKKATSQFFTNQNMQLSVDGNLGEINASHEEEE